MSYFGKPLSLLHLCSEVVRGLAPSRGPFLTFVKKLGFGGFRFMVPLREGKTSWPGVANGQGC